MSKMLPLVELQNVDTQLRDINELLGDLIINVYFFLMSIYGWVFWSRKDEGIVKNKISRLNLSESIFTCGNVAFYARKP